MKTLGVGASSTPRNRHRIAMGLSLLAVLSCGDSATAPAPAPPPPPVPPPAPRPTTVSVNPATAALTAVGATVRLAAEVRDQNGQTMAGATVTWTSDAPAVATVNSAGVATAVANGTATITATAGDASGSASLTVAQEVSAVAVTLPADSLEVGDTLRVVAVLRTRTDTPWRRRRSPGLPATRRWSTWTNRGWRRRSRWARRW